MLADAKYVKRMKKAYDSNLPIPGPEDRRPSLVKIASLTAIAPIQITTKEQPRENTSSPTPQPESHQLDQQQKPQTPIQGQPQAQQQIQMQRLQQEQFDSPEGTPILQRNIPSNNRNPAYGNRRPTEDVEAR